MYQYLDIKLISKISLIGLAYIIVILIAMHKLRPDLNPRSRYISEYAVDKYGKLAASSFVIYGLAILGIYLCLQAVMPGRAKSNIGLTLLGIWGAAKVIIGFFKVDTKYEKITLHGAIHSIASSVGVATSEMALIYFSFNFVHDENTQSIAFVTQVTAIIGLVLTVFLSLGYIGDLMLKYCKNIKGILLIISGYVGLIERLLLSVSIVWLTTYGSR